MILCKEGVRFRKLIPEIYGILSVLDVTFESHGVDCVITSANDSHHMDGSLHYSDRALDLRSHDLPSGEEQAVVRDLMDALGMDYDVLFEDEGTPNEHIHVEYDPS